MPPIEGPSPATPADLPALRALAEAAYAPYTPRLGGREAPAMRPDFAAHIASGRVVVLRRAGCPVAYLIHRAEGADWHIENLAVAPDLQGRGLGRRLIAHAERVARAASAGRLTLFTNERMTENQALYRRLGFVETGRRERKGTEVIDYEKRLGATRRARGI